VILLPVYACEFGLVYAMRIPIISNTPLISQFLPFFAFRYRWPVAEQLLYFAILACFFMSVSCFKLVFAYDQDQVLKDAFFNRCKDKNASSFYKFLFFILKHIQTLVLICLFINGA
jgi:hypothetical protein